MVVSNGATFQSDVPAAPQRANGAPRRTVRNSSLIFFSPAAWCFPPLTAPTPFPLQPLSGRVAARGLPRRARRHRTLVTFICKLGNNAARQWRGRPALRWRPRRRLRYSAVTLCRPSPPLRPCSAPAATRSPRWRLPPYRSAASSSCMPRLRRRGGRAVRLHTACISAAFDNNTRGSDTRRYLRRHQSQ